MKQGHLLVFQMAEEGIEYSWKVDVRVGTEEIADTCFRKAAGYIEVTENQLYLVDYDCLTMAAQFEDHKVFKIGYELDKNKFYSWLGGVDPEYRKH
nr:hypothetical protein [Cytobacillus solani]